ncbi:hypothetical protein X801_00868, partial [Opisthorchis viverrini]
NDLQGEKLYPNKAVFREEISESARLYNARGVGLCDETFSNNWRGDHRALFCILYFARYRQERLARFAVCMMLDGKRKIVPIRGRDAPWRNYAVGFIMTVFNLYIFDQRGVCVYYHEWTKTKQGEKPSENETKLLHVGNPTVSTTDGKASEVPQ